MLRSEARQEPIYDNRGRRIFGSSEISQLPVSNSRGIIPVS